MDRSRTYKVFLEFYDKVLAPAGTTSAPLKDWMDEPSQRQESVRALDRVSGPINLPSVWEVQSVFS